MNQSYYEPGLYGAADYIITSSATRGRYVENPARFAGQVGFYELLDRVAQPMSTFESSAWVSGPTIRVYHVTPSCRDSLRRRGLDRMWWAGWMQGRGGRYGVENSAREAQLIQNAGAREQMRRVYDDCYREFADELTYLTLARGDTATAERLASSAIANNPANIQAAIIYSLCVGSRRAWNEAKQALEGALEGNPDEAMLMLQLSRVEAKLRQPGRQRDYLLRVQRGERPGSPLRVEAESELRRLAVNN